MGSLAEQLINGVSKIVMRRSRSLDSVRVAIMAGTEQPKPTSIGTKLAAGQSQLAERPIHDKGHTRHIAGVLQNREEEEQRYNGRQEAEYAANAVCDAVYNERVNNGIDLQADNPASSHEMQASTRTVMRRTAMRRSS